MPRVSRRIAIVAAALAVIVAIVGARVVVSSRAELGAGDRARQGGDGDAARLHYRRAAKWYAPGNPYCTEALDRLAEMAELAEADGELESALASWRSVRASILATRSTYVPHRARLEQANEHIAELMAESEPPPIDAGKSREEIRDAHLALLQTIPQPDRGWTLVLLLGFLGWLVGAFLFARRAVDEEDRFVRREALRWGILTAVGFVLFMVGLSQA